MRKERAASGYTSLRVSNATRALMRELATLIPPHELRGEDELVWELVSAEIERQRANAATPRVTLAARAS